MKRRENFTAYETMPEDLAIYLSQNGPHFNKACCEFAVSLMYKEDKQGNEEAIKPLSKGDVENILSAYNVKPKYAQLNDCVYVANMCKADYYESSVPTEEHLAKYIKDAIDDPDGVEGLIFNRWIADMKWIGVAIPWDEFL